MVIWALLYVNPAILGCHRLLDRQALEVRRVGEVLVMYQPVESVTYIWMACVNSQATIFAPFVFRLLLNRYVASEGLGEVGSMLGFFDLFCLISECQ